MVARMQMCVVIAITVLSSASLSLSSILVGTCMVIHALKQGCLCQMLVALTTSCATFPTITPFIVDPNDTLQRSSLDDGNDGIIINNIIIIVIAGSWHHQHGLVCHDLFGWNVLENKNANANKMNESDVSTTTAHNKSINLNHLDAILQHLQQMLFQQQ